MNALMKNRPRLRRARPLLLAGFSATLMGCPQNGPMGNLMAVPQPDLLVAQPDGPMGNLMASPDLLPADGGVADGGDGGISDAGRDGPFGNLLQPPPDLHGK